MKGASQGQYWSHETCVKTRASKSIEVDPEISFQARINIKHVSIYSLGHQ